MREGAQAGGLGPVARPQSGEQLPGSLRLGTVADGLLGFLRCRELHGSLVICR